MTKYISLSERETEVILSALMAVQSTDEGPGEAYRLHDKIRMQTGCRVDTPTMNGMIANVLAEAGAFPDSAPIIVRGA